MFNTSQCKVMEFWIRDKRHKLHYTMKATTCQGRLKKETWGEDVTQNPSPPSPHSFYGPIPSMSHFHGPHVSYGPSIPPRLLFPFMVAHWSSFALYLHIFKLPFYQLRWDHKQFKSLRSSFLFRFSFLFCQLFRLIHYRVTSVCILLIKKSHFLILNY